MIPLEFLQRVLPTEGFYTSIIINSGEAPQQAFFSTVGELADYCLMADKNGNNVYYAVSSFEKKGNRTQKNVCLNKTLFLDIDCGSDKVDQVDNSGDPIEDKGYATQKLGLAALAKFIAVTGMPRPMIISSGRGLHVYWVLEKGLSPADWQPLANALKDKFKVNGFAFDPAVTADSARVLRPVGTHNPKNKAEVVVLMDAAPTEIQVLQNILGAVSSVPMTQIVAPVHRDTGLSDALSVEFTPAVPSLVIDGCQQIKWITDNQKDVPEPLWYDMLGVAAHCVDPEETAKLWSMKHPDYNEATTLRKMAHWMASTTGPATCTKIEDDRPNGCNKCKHKGNITSPAQLGVQYEKVAASSDAPDEVARDVVVPWPYERVSKKGQTVMVCQVDGTHITVCPFEVYPVSYGKDQSLGYETVRFKWKRRHVGWQDLVFRQAYLNYGSREFPTSIADQGIVLRGDKQIKDFQMMLRSYMDELRKTKTMTNIHSSMGWKENYTQFVVGDKVYKRGRDGTVVADDIALTANTNRLGNTLFTQKGSLEEWVNATGILQTHNLPAHMFTLNHSFGAPLWALTGLKGITMSLFGKTGAGKTLAQLWAQSLWGNPDKLHVSAKFTQNALFNRLGMYCNLPMSIDEAGMMEDKYIGDFCYAVTQGEDKKRLTRTIEEREVKEWATCVIVSTNTSFISKLAASGMESDAQMARLLEVEMPMHKMFNKSSNAGRSIIKFLSDNHGAAGEAYVKAFLARGETHLRELIIESMDTFEGRYGCTFTGSERYWETNLVLGDVGGRIAQEEGLIKYNPEIGVQWGVNQLDVLRNSVKDNATDAFKLIHEYINEKAHEALVVMHTDGRPSAMDLTRFPRSQMSIRFDKYRKGQNKKFDRGTMMLVSRLFKKWVSSRGYDYNMLKKEIRSAGIDATPEGGRFWMSKDTALKAGQQNVLGINLNCDIFRGYLEDTPVTAQDATLGQLAEVITE